MKFTELKRALRSKIEPVYICYGDDRMVMEIAVSHIMEATKGELPEFDVATFNDKADIADIFESLNTLPISASKRVTYLKDFNLKTIKEQISDYAKNPNTTSVLVVTTYEEVQIDNAVMVDCNRLDKPILMLKVTKELKERGCTIDNDALSLLIDYCDNDLGRITQETLKLSVNKHITLKDIQENTNKAENYNVFALTESLGKKDAKSAIKAIDYLLQDDSKKGVISAIYNHFHRLFYIAVNPLLSDDEVASQLGVKSYAIKVSRPQVKYFGVKRLKEILDLIREADLNTKTTWASVETYAYYLVLNILNKK